MFKCFPTEQLRFDCCIAMVLFRFAVRVRIKYGWFLCVDVVHDWTLLHFRFETNEVITTQIIN